MSEEETNTTKDKSVMLFGRDISKIPCFRNSFLYGTLGGLGFGLSYFMFTSKVGKAVNNSIYAFTLITMGYWMQCRYDYSKTRFEMLKLQELMRNQNILEGSEVEEKMQQQPDVIEV